MIRVENLSKMYRIGHLGRSHGYRTFRESIADAGARLFRKRRGEAARRTEDFWALKDLDFEVAGGEVVGIVGHNGAGKSTLLKILSRITTPTTGRVEIHGRVGSLLEVGTGFHPELTGRENIYLNGSILGMSRREIARRFDAIVAFSEIENFLDMPVKRYSSGMYVRLAFAVASHLEPEILVIDEVLAVGDQSFQRKCLGRMGEESRSGRTVLFVSHNMAAVEALCGRCILLNRGRIVAQGETGGVLAKYLALASDRSQGRADLTDHKGRTSASTRYMETVTLGDGVEEPTATLKMGSGLTIRVEFDTGGRPVRPVLGVVIKTGMGVPLFGMNNRLIPNYEFESCRSSGAITCAFAGLPLMPGNYVVDLYFGDEHRDLDVVMDSVTFNVIESDVFGSGKLPPQGAGPIFWPASWDVVYQQSV